MASESGTTYRDAGVNIEEGEEAVRRFKPIVRSTFTPGVLTDIGAFGAFFAPDFGAYADPVLVSSVDGVGTKLKVAFAAGRHDTVGQDLVNHCVNDIAVCGADPLFFLDYFATGKLESDVAVKIIEGFATACRENGVALIGGETAEMPDMYTAGEYDLAGTVVGMVSRSEIIDGSRIAEGDLLLGVASTGLHTNGFSLARRILFQNHNVDHRPPSLGGLTLGEALLAVHRSYLALIRLTRRSCHAFVHVTGGGIPGNTARLLPEGLDVDIDYDSWLRPPIFGLIQKEGRVPEDDMRRTFNLGIGLVAVVPAGAVAAFSDAAVESGDQVFKIGRVVRRP
jgi:phosphoribosylformylglycinamidine cyclo-ligase